MTTVTTQEPRSTVSVDVLEKARAIYAKAGVRQVAEDELSRTFRVGCYTVLQHRENVDADRCTCAWNRYQPYATAVCSHVMAARLDIAMPRPAWRKALLRLAGRIGR